MKIYTKTGDAGETGLLGGKRVSKNHPAIEACGDTDEANCQIGFALSMSQYTPINDVLNKIQHDLFVVGGELANCLAGKTSTVLISLSDIELLERAIDENVEALPPMDAFILPGGCGAGAALHVARAVCRRAERRVVELAASPLCQADLSLCLIYLNRLSDYLFVAARRLNAESGAAETKWLPDKGHR